MNDIDIFEIIGRLSAMVGLAIATYEAWNSAFIQGLFQRPTWRAVEKMVEKIRSKMPDDYSPKVILGVGRGGAIAAALIANSFKKTIPIFVLSIDHSREGEPLYDLCEPRADLEDILVVCATVNRGHSMSKVVEKLRDCGAESIQTACLVRYSNGTATPTYFGKERLKRQQFPWMKKPTRFWVQDFKSKETTS